MKIPTRPGVAAPSLRRGATGLPRFAAGDLITAEQLNRMVDAIAALEARVAALEARPPA